MALEVNNNLNIQNPYKVDYNKLYAPVLAPKTPIDQKPDEVLIQKNELEQKFDLIQSKQGIVGKVWDGIKNTLKMNNSSDSVKNVIEAYKKNEISYESAQKTLDKFASGQQKALDFVADWGSTVIGAGAFALSLPLCAGCVPAALGVAAFGGAAFKVITKKLDANSNGREYKSMPFDIVTGAINGLLSPLANGVGNIVIKKIAGKLGLKTVAKTALKGTLSANAGSFEKILLNIATAPKQKIQGTILSKILPYSIGRGIKSCFKLGVAFGLRELTFKSFNSDSLLKTNAVMGLPMKILEKDPKFQDKLPEFQDKFKTSKTDFSNDMYGLEKEEQEASLEKKEEQKA